MPTNVHFKFNLNGPSWKINIFWSELEKFTFFGPSWNFLIFFVRLEEITFLVSLFSWQGVQEWGAGGPFQVILGHI